MKHAECELWKAKDVARLLALLEADRRYYFEIVATLPVPLALAGVQRNIVFANRSFLDLFRLDPRKMAHCRLEDFVSVTELADRLRELAECRRREPLTLTGRAALPGGPQRVRVVAQLAPCWEEGAEPEVLVVLENEGEESPPAEGIPGAAPGVGSTMDAPVLLWELDAHAMCVRSCVGSEDVIPAVTPRHYRESRSFPPDFVVPADRERYVVFYQDLAAGRISSGQIEYRAGAPGTSPAWVLDTAVAHSGRSGEVDRISVATVSVSEKRLHDSQREQAQLLEAMSRFCGRMAHVSNNLLMIISGYCESLAETHPEDGQLQQDLSEIRRAADRLAATVERLQGVSKKSGRPPNEIDLTAFLAGYAAKAARQDLRLELQPGALWVLADGEDLTRLLDGLLALADPNQPLIVRTALTPWPAAAEGHDGGLAAGRYAAIVLSGAFDEAQARRAITEPELEEPAARPAASDLAALHRSIQLNGGGIAVWNEGGGVAVAVFLRLTSQAPQARTEGQSSAVSTAPTILIAEDEAGIRALVRKILLRQGYRVVDAASAADALKEAEASQSPIDLLITDMQLGSASGSDLAEAVRKRHPKARVLYVSGYAEDAGVQAALASGRFPEGVQFLAKPFTLGALLGKVRAAIESV